MSPRLLPAELDRALAAHVAFLGQPNRRPVRCVLCGTFCPVRTAWRLWLDGFRRGFVCHEHARGLPTRAQAAQARSAA